MDNFHLHGEVSIVLGAGVRSADDILYEHEGAGARLGITAGPLQSSPHLSGFMHPLRHLSVITVHIHHSVYALRPVSGLPFNLFLSVAFIVNDGLETHRKDFVCYISNTSDRLELDLC